MSGKNPPVVAVISLLLVAGTGLQVWGVIQVAIELRATRARLHDYATRPQTWHGSTATARVEVLQPGITTNVWHPVNQRVGQLETQLNEMRGALSALRRATGKEAEAAAESAATRVHDMARSETDALAPLILGLNDGHTSRRRILSVIAITVGLVITMVGSLLSLVDWQESPACHECSAIQAPSERPGAF